jgi:hypothetical protein
MCCIMFFIKCLNVLYYVFHEESGCVVLRLFRKDLNVFYYVFHKVSECVELGFS